MKVRFLGPLFFAAICGTLSSNVLAKTPAVNNSVEQIRHIRQVNPVALKFALNAYQWAVSHGYVKNKQYLTLVDFTKASNKERLVVIDLKSQKVVLKTYCSHGKGSGFNKTTHFSNSPGSHASMYGSFIVTNPYVGAHGKSLRVKGLERGINNNALSRAVVIHGAQYATSSFVKRAGRAGRSYGCFAVDPNEMNQLISKLKNSSFLYAYASQAQKLG
jgi:hypothetical protein